MTIDCSSASVFNLANMSSSSRSTCSSTDEESSDSEAHLFNIDTLQVSCLDSILKNLKKFSIAISTTTDPTLLRNLHFLQKIYTGQLVEMYGRKEFEDFHFNFLVNEYSKEISLHQIIGLDRGTVLERIAAVGPGLEKVVMEEGSFTEQHSIVFVNEIAQHLQHVKVLQLGRYCTDETLKTICSVCQEVEELHLKDSLISDDGLKLFFNKLENGTIVCKLNSIRIISLTDRFLTEDAINFLVRNMPSVDIIISTVEDSDIDSDSSFRMSDSSCDLCHQRQVLHYDLEALDMDDFDDVSEYWAEYWRQYYWNEL